MFRHSCDLKYLIQIAYLIWTLMTLVVQNIVYYQFHTCKTYPLTHVDVCNKICAVEWKLSSPSFLLPPPPSSSLSPLFPLPWQRLWYQFKASVDRLLDGGAHWVGQQLLPDESSCYHCPPPWPSCAASSDATWTTQKKGQCTWCVDCSQVSRLIS